MGVGTNGITVNLSGGTFSGEEGFYAGGGNASWATSQFTISDGVFENGAGFTGAISADLINTTGGEYHQYLVSYGTVQFIKAGTFTEDAMYASGGYLADGYKFVQDGSMYVVVPNSDPREAIPTNAVYYYWLNGNGTRGGGYYNFYAPFEGPDPVLMDGEFIELLGDIRLSKNVTYLDECSFGDPISKGGTFYLTFGDYNIDLNGFAFPIPAGVSVKTDKQTNIFSASEAGYVVSETAISESGFNYLYTVAKAVAQVGTTSYATLAEAAAAAAAAAPASTTIKLVDNVDLRETVVISGNVILDLNGKTINNTTDIWAGDNWSLISVQGAGSSLTIQGNGTLDAKENDCYAIDVCDGATLTVKNGVFYGNISAIYAYEGIVTVEGGEFHVKQLSEFNDARYLLNCLDGNYSNGTSNFIVSGGTFYNFDPGNNLAEGTGTNFLASGHTTTSSTSGSDTVYVVQ